MFEWRIAAACCESLDIDRRQFALEAFFDLLDISYAAIQGTIRVGVDTNQDCVMRMDNVLAMHYSTVCYVRVT